jgi:hypothetical protein
MAEMPCNAESKVSRVVDDGNYAWRDHKSHVVTPIMLDNIDGFVQWSVHLNITWSKVKITSRDSFSSIRPEFFFARKITSRYSWIGWTRFEKKHSWMNWSICRDVLIRNKTKCRKSLRFTSASYRNLDKVHVLSQHMYYDIRNSGRRS